MPVIKTNGSRAKAKSILCVEDDPDTCEILSIILREFRFDYSYTVAGALSKLQPPGHDLYILDNWLPDGSGIALCREIRALYPKVPIVFTSAIGRSKDIDEALAAGANRYLLKPCEPDELQRIVKELI